MEREMTMTQEMKKALVENLKLFNAKERDHLMRDAYLGIGSAEGDIDYGKATRFLSAEFDKRLKEHIRKELKLEGEARCVFAGMDYHLDWIFAALWMATQNPGWPNGAASTPVKMADHTRVDNLDSMYTDFRPVMGIQEDIDLLAVYEVDNTLALMFVEAKGSAAFDRVQLARKLIRLDRILVDSGIAKNCSNSLPYLLVLASPNAPVFRDAKDHKKNLNCLEFAKQLPMPRAEGKKDKFKAMREALEDHKSEIGLGLHYLPISGYPKTTFAVKRVGLDASDDKNYTHWTLEKRRTKAKQ